MSKLSENAKKYLLDRIEAIEYGSVEVELNGSDTVTIVSERRKRFDRPDRFKPSQSGAMEFDKPHKG